MKKLLKNYLSIAHNFPRHTYVFSTKDRFFRKNLGKNAKKPPGSGESGGCWLLWKMIYQRLAVSL